MKRILGNLVKKKYQADEVMKGGNGEIREDIKERKKLLDCS